ncbi:OPT family oligopeptide transporter [Sinanaerobacter sp. ZZT-01]|uniref:OPT family oligopeptide transporter n=1 Tax=Sinanaerobacter sp. ZZT-01 TaxID=3111540 RepID=UPI002D77B7B2|nr:oligopeptide transporter, OPT family [Sinanaerobacter sp. ZZT-01]WRR92891.1 oligopeptide transporter, OPT family [Sinanaerobacter sp. ZZT-01]
MATNKKDFKPFIAADKIVPEFTFTSIFLGIILAIVFGAANAYLGLRVGMTVSASIPAAVISMGIIRLILKKESILENNLVQTIGSAGESVAAGAIFTLPAIFLWAGEGLVETPTLIEIFLISLVGGLLGVLFMIPLRKALIVEEHGVLPYPEGTACAEVLLAGEEGGAKASTVFAGLGVAAGYKFVSDGLNVFPSSVESEISGYKGSMIGMDILPALLGVGYICGPKISGYMLSGGILGWFVLMPLISLFGGDVVIFPAEDPISILDPWGLWGSYVRYIGAGAVAAGGILSLIKSLPLIIKTFSHAMKSFSKAGGNSDIRTEQDLHMPTILGCIAIIAVAIWLLPVFPVTLLGAIIIVLFGFFFATVSSRMVGLVGSSNNPVSGMAIATLLIATTLLKVTGINGADGMVGAIAIGSIICIVAAIAGDTSQDLKTGFLLGATPKKQQIGEIIGVFVSAVTIGGVLYLLNEAWGFGSKEILAPQASMMKMIVEGVMNAELPWTLIFAGVGIAILIEVLGVPVLPFAVGLYLPLGLSTGIMVGGLVRLYIDKKKNISEEERKDSTERGILYTSGLIAGEGLVGVLLAIFAVIKFADKETLADKIGVVGNSFNIGQIGGIIIFALLTLSLVYVIVGKKRNS